MDAWHAQFDAEEHFKRSQFAVAKIQPADLNELRLMAAAAVYDRVRTTGLHGALISYGVVLGYFRLMVPPCA